MVGGIIIGLCFVLAAICCLEKNIQTGLILLAVASMFFFSGVLAGFKAEKTAIPSSMEVRCQTIGGAKYSKSDDACYMNGIKLDFKEEDGEQ